MQTLIAPQPVDRLLFRKGTSSVGKTRWMQDALLVIPLQLAWALRCFLLPVCAAMGTSFALGSADSAVDIVLNSVAVGFLFELDDVMYTSKQQQHTIAAAALTTRHSQPTTHPSISPPVLLDDKQRRAYERSPPEPGTCLAVPGSTTVCSRYSWLIAAADFVIVCMSYLKQGMRAVNGSQSVEVFSFSLLPAACCSLC